MRTSMLAFRTDPLPHVRIGLVGLGQRGLKTLQRYRFLRHASIVGVADLDETRTAAANAELAASGREQAVAYNGPNCWRDICGQANVDLIYICTDWETHASIAVEAMRRGKHVAVEVPAATTVDECRLLVETAEETQRHCFMTENCCYDYFALCSYEMARQGKFGHIHHCEGAYIHDLSEEESGETEWMERTYARHGGNPYPTHGIGSIAFLLGLHRGDRMERLTSLTSAGHQNTSIIQTAKGRTILLQLDVYTHRPYSRLQTTCGTLGYAQKYPTPTLQFDGSPVLVGAEAEKAAEAYATSDAAQRWKVGRRLGVPNEMNYAMDSRLIHCLHHGLPLDIDVYDAAEWSCLAELSRRSALQGGMPVDVPDFTGGRWRELDGHTFYDISET